MIYQTLLRLLCLKPKGGFSARATSVLLFAEPIEASRIKSTLATALVSLAILGMTPSLALPQGTTCLPITASRATLVEAQDFARSINKNLYPEVRQSPNGFFAITLNRQKFSENGYSLSRLKEKGAVPSDAFCSSGSGFSEPISKLVEAKQGEQAGNPLLHPMLNLASISDKTLLATVVWLCLFVLTIVLRFLLGGTCQNRTFKSPTKGADYPLTVKKVLISEGAEIGSGTEVARFVSSNANSIHRRTITLNSESAGVVEHVAISRGDILKTSRIVYSLQSAKTPLAKFMADNVLTSALASILVLYLLSHPKWAAEIVAGSFNWPTAIAQPHIILFAGVVALLHVWRFGPAISTLVALVPATAFLAFFELDPLKFSTPWDRYAEAREEERNLSIAEERRVAAQVEADRQAELLALTQQLSLIAQSAIENEHKFIGKLKFSCSAYSDTFPGRFSWTIAKLEQGKERTEKYVSCLRKYMRRGTPEFVQGHNSLALRYSKLATRWWKLSSSTMPPRALVSKISADYIEGRIEQTLVQAKLDEYNKTYKANIEVAERNTREMEEEQLRRQNLARALAQWSAQNQRMLDQQLSQMIYGVRPFSNPGYRSATGGGIANTTPSVAQVNTTSAPPKTKYRWASCDYADSNFSRALSCVSGHLGKREPNTKILYRCAPDEKNCHRGVWGSVLTDMPDNLNEVLPPLKQD